MNKLFKIPIIGKKLLRHITAKEGGEQVSSTMRTLALKRGVNIGMYSYGSCFRSDFNIGGKVEIGKYCSFGPNVHYFGANHPINEAVMSPYFYRKEFGFDVSDVEREKLNVGNDVWCGYGVTITANCHSIGNGAVIGAGAVVTKDVPAYSIVTGCPAKIIRYRFDEDTINLLEKSKWWELTPDELYKFYNIRKNPKEFALEIINKRKL